MLDSDPTDPTDSNTNSSETGEPPPRKRAPRKSAKAAKAAPPDPGAPPAADESTPAEPIAPRKRAPRKAVAKTGAKAPVEPPSDQVATTKAPAAKAAAKRAAKKAASTPAADLPSFDPAAAAAPVAEEAPAKKATRKRAAKKAPAAEPVESASTDQADAGAPAAMTAPGVLFMAPQADEPAAPRRRRTAKKAAAEPAPADAQPSEPRTDSPPADLDTAEDDSDADPEDVREAAIEQASGARRRRRRGRRGRGGGTRAEDDNASDSDGQDSKDDDEPAEGADTGTDEAKDGDDGEGSGSAATRRRRRRRRSGSDDDSGSDDPPNTVTHVRDKKSGGGGGGGGGGKDSNDDGVKGVKGSTRLEAKRQRRRDGRETTRRRAPILTESEFLARREAVERVMAVRQNGDRTQIAVLEDDVLVEHYVTRASATSYVGNVYLGRVQNVLPSMEAAFIDIGKGRNGVLYAGEVNWDAAGLDGKSRTIEHALKSGDPVLVQVTKDPIGHKGARLTSQVSLPGRFLVYVPGGGMTGISRRLPDTERHRLKSILKKIVPEDAGVIVRTAAEGASEEDLTHDVERLQAQWETIQKQSEKSKSAPVLVHGEPDLAIRVVRDVFNEDFTSLVVQGEDAWTTVSDYVQGVAPDLGARISRHTAEGDLFHDLRVDEQLMKALDRKVWLPSGGSLVIDRTEAMTVVDVNTGKYVGSGGNLEQTVTRNNLEAAEEIVRQLRLRDVGGIVVIDFIDMVLESNRELVLKRLTECLGRDRTKHQVAEVTSLGLVQMTRKRVGEGLLEAFSEPCEVCRGRGVIVHGEPVDQSTESAPSDDDRSRGKRKRGGRNASTPEPVETVEPPATPEQRQAAVAAISAIHRATAAERLSDEADIVDQLATGLVAAAMDAGTSRDAPVPPVDPPLVDPPADTAPSTDISAQQDPTAAAVESVAAVEEVSSEPSTEHSPASGPSVNGAAHHVEPVDDAEPAGVGTPAPGRRRRRGASRPAGPPSGS